MSLGDALLHLKWILIYNSGITLLKIIAAVVMLYRILFKEREAGSINFDL